MSSAASDKADSGRSFDDLRQARQGALDFPHGVRRHEFMVLFAGSTRRGAQPQLLVSQRSWRYSAGPGEERHG